MDNCGLAQTVLWKFLLGNLGLPQQRFAEIMANSHSLPCCSEGSSDHVAGAVDIKEWNRPTPQVLILQLGGQAGDEKALVHMPRCYFAFMAGYRC